MEIDHKFTYHLITEERVYESSCVEIMSSKLSQLGCLELVVRIAVRLPFASYLELIM